MRMMIGSRKPLLQISQNIQCHLDSQEWIKEGNDCAHSELYYLYLFYQFGGLVYFNDIINVSLSVNM